METIYISENNIKITMFINNNKLFYIDHNNTNVDINKYLDIIKTIDEDYFNNNGEECIFFINKNDDKKSKMKKFRFGNIVIIISLATLLFNATLCTLLALETRGHLITNITANNSYFDVNFSSNEIKNIIYSSPNLTDEEKEILYNEEFFNDLLSTVGNSNYLKYKLDKYLANLSIESYDELNPIGKEVSGYYDIVSPDKLHVLNYEQLDEDTKKTVIHEFIHLCQDTIVAYNFFIEPCANIITKEYYGYEGKDSYMREEQLIKILMEIIGPQPIWNYIFTGDFSGIENEIKPYLSSEEYKSFIKCISYSEHTISSENEMKLEEILSILYKSKFNDDIENNRVISLLNNYSEFQNITRNYFNYRNSESYYYGTNNSEKRSITTEEAMNLELLTVKAVKNTPLSYEEAMNYILNNDGKIVRKLIFDNHEYKITQIITRNQNKYFSGTIDGIDYFYSDVDNLYNEGIIDIEYYLVDEIELSKEDYLSQNYPDGYELNYTYSTNLSINNDGTLMLTIPHKEELPSVFEEKSYILR